MCLCLACVDDDDDDDDDDEEEEEEDDVKEVDADNDNNIRSTDMKYSIRFGTTIKMFLRVFAWLVLNYVRINILYSIRFETKTMCRPPPKRLILSLNTPTPLSKTKSIIGPNSAPNICWSRENSSWDDPAFETLYRYLDLSFIIYILY